MKKIVILTGSYYPKSSAVGKCMFNIVNSIHDFEKYVISNITTLSDTYSINIYDQTIIRFSTNDLKIMLGNNNTKKIFNRIKRYIKIIFSKVTVNRSNLNEYINELGKIDDIDCIICSCFPIETLIAAEQYKNNHSNVKLIAILFDRFAEGDKIHRNNINKFLKYKNNQNLERKVFRSFDYIYYMKSWEKYIKINFPEIENKSKCIEHPLITKKNIKHLTNTGNIYNFLYAGSFLKGYIEPYYLLRLLNNLNADESIYRIQFFINENSRRLICKAKIDKDLYSINNWISSEELDVKMSESDFLLSISEYKGQQLSSKIFNYISTGKPIIHIYYCENDINLKYLKKYDLCLLINANDKLDKNVELIKNWCKQNKGKSISYDQILKHYYELTPEYISTMICNYVYEK